MEIKKTVDIIKWDSGRKQEMRDEIIVEEAVEILLNGKHFVYLMCTPCDMDELAIGYLFAEGVIDSADQIGSIDHLDWNRICVNIKKELMTKRLKDFIYDNDENDIEMRAIASGCGKGKVSLISLDEIKRIANGKKYKISDIARWMNDFGNRSVLFKETGGVHSCAAVKDGEILFFAEDIGRHNALDKVIGKLLIDHVDFDEIVLLSTGRISYDISIKAAKAGIPLVASFSAPTDRALTTARKANITLIGFVRGRRMNIYNGEQRVDFDA